MLFRRTRDALMLVTFILGCNGEASDTTNPLASSGSNRLIAQCTYAGDPTCTDSLPETHGQVGINIPGFTPSVCSNTAGNPDTDHDGLIDLCEERLAQEFAPFLLQSRAPSIFDAPTDWTTGDYYHAVRAPLCTPGGCDDVRIAYFMAYYFDAGTDGGSGTIDYGHNGDSEFIMVDVGYDASSQRWVAHGVFLSAHCGSTHVFVSTAPACRWYPSNSFSNLGLILGGAPSVWVAKGTNANYPTYSDCQGGTYYLDMCDRTNLGGGRFPISIDFNIGSPSYNPGSVQARRYPARASIFRFENFWTGSTFRGWQPTGAGETSYATILQNFGFFR